MEAENICSKNCKTISWFFHSKSQNCKEFTKLLLENNYEISRILFHWYFSYSRFGGKDPAYYEFTIGKCYVYMFSTLTMRGWDTLPSKFPAKIALISLLFFGTMIYWHWEAMLLSYLATRVTSLPFIDIPVLLKKAGAGHFTESAPGFLSRFHWRFLAQNLIFVGIKKVQNLSMYPNF